MNLENLVGKIVRPIGLAAALYIGGCGPSQSEIEPAIRSSLAKGVPVRLAGHLMGCSNATVEELKILEVGSKEKSFRGQDMWSVKVYARGTCDKAFIGRSGFNGEVEYKVGKDSYGKWVASSDTF